MALTGDGRFSRKTFTEVGLGALRCTVSLQAACNTLAKPRGRIGQATSVSGTGDGSVSDGRSTVQWKDFVDFFQALELGGPGCPRKHLLFEPAPGIY